MLGISAALLASGLAFIGDRLGDTQFEQATNNLESEVRLILDDVSDSSSSNSVTNDVKCTALPIPADHKATGITLTKSTTGVGTNSDCEYLGDVIAFSTKAGDNTELEIYPVAGLRFYSSNFNPFTNQEPYQVTTLGPLSYASLITPSTAQPSSPDDSTQYSLGYGLTVTNACNSSNVALSGAGIIINSLGAYASSVLNALSSGAIQLNLYSFGSTYSQPWATQVGNINNSLQDSNGAPIPDNPDQTQSVSIYLTDNDGHYATLTISSGNGQLTTSLSTSSSAPTPPC